MSECERERVCFCESDRDAVVLKELIMTQDTVKITRPRCAQNYLHNCQERDRCKLLGEMVSRIILVIILERTVGFQQEEMEREGRSFFHVLLASHVEHSLQLRMEVIFVHVMIHGFHPLLPLFRRSHGAADTYPRQANAATTQQRKRTTARSCGLCFSSLVLCVCCSNHPFVHVRV